MNHRLAQAMKPWAALQFSDWLLPRASGFSLEPSFQKLEMMDHGHWRGQWGRCLTRDGGALWWGAQRWPSCWVILHLRVASSASGCCEYISCQHPSPTEKRFVHIFQERAWGNVWFMTGLSGMFNSLGTFLVLFRNWLLQTWSISCLSYTRFSLKCH